MPLHCGDRRCDDSETGLLISVERPHPQPPCANNPAPRLLRRRLLGYLYAHGKGVLEDDTEAVRWFRLGAEQGRPDAQFNLGLMYDNGEGVPEDDAEAVRWSRLAAEQGDAAAQNHLGVMYEFASGVPQDFVQAHK